MKQSDDPLDRMVAGLPPEAVEWAVPAFAVLRRRRELWRTPPGRRRRALRKLPLYIWEIEWARAVETALWAAGRAGALDEVHPALIVGFLHALAEFEMARTTAGDARKWCYA